MWKKTLLFAFTLGVLVFIGGYGHVLPFRLVLRTILVILGTVLTVIAAEKAVNIFVKPETKGPVTPNISKMDLQGIEEDEEGSTGEPGTAEAEEQPSDIPEPESPEEELDVEDDSDIEELADMVSDTMSQDEGQEV